MIGLVTYMLMVVLKGLRRRKVGKHFSVVVGMSKGAGALNFTKSERNYLGDNIARYYC